ncbi:hypothetical protein [Methylorubrum sp. SL192]|uniref:hypothetical protein n=1 Tax=Methylorubrum sp. SL192 TaxID=2995167 RepID=UPI0022743F26|nr:hypothetical protein [Methylorubrum sp. SL192]MCY1644023.1 hypothetical protein [Methylorubrum sp. SL192]
MSSPEIDFRAIRPHHGSRHNGFEEVVCQLAALDTLAGMPFHRKGIGADAGLECYRVERDGSETGWQAKYFFEFGSGEAGQLTESFNNAVDKHPTLARFVVCLPFDFSDGRVGKRKSERDRWDDWKAARKVSIAPRVVEIELWGSFQLTERLSRNDPLHVGRRTYWFDIPHFSIEWMRDRFAITRAALGRRYSPELNVELPIRQSLVAFARDPDFVRTLLDLADDVDESRHRAVDRIRDVLGTPYDDLLVSLREEAAAVSSSIRKAPLGPTDPIPLATWRALASAAIATLNRCSTVMWDTRRKPGGEGEAARSGIHFAERLREVLDRVVEVTAADGIRLANTRRLLLTGEAGVGKSHLLADVAEHHIGRGFPAVLALGAAFGDADPWRQMSDQLGLIGMPPDAILGALDAAAEAAGARALVMVDALNERNGVAVWSERIAAFLATADRFAHVAVLASCRTTFVPYIVRDLDEAALPRLAHPGFAGKATEAARRYLDQRGIVRMAAPHLAPEFENPLFLRTCCDMLERRGERELPRGIAGVSSIFDFYFRAVIDTLNRRMGLEPRLKRAERALDAITEAMVAAAIGYLPLDTAISILETIHPSAGRAEQSLWSQFETEGVLAVEPMGENGIIVEMVRFTFERLSDHRIAQRLLETHVGRDDPEDAFGSGGPLAPYVVGSDAYRFAGVAEALAVQLPERYGVELIDVVKNRGAQWELVHGFQLSLLWRRQDVFTERTMELVKIWADAIGGDAVLETILSVATEPRNRFNASDLHSRLQSLSLPERDLQWSTRAANLAEEGEGAIQTLIEWVLVNGLEEIEPERAQLAGITLAWLTSLSHRWVRDMATKALATLLVDRRDLAASLVRSFADVGDPYVVDRVLAASYGAATRRTGSDGLAELARNAFAAVFARDPLPVHALVRDHACGIIELAAYRGVLPDDVPLDRVRPPYLRGEPLEEVGEETIDGYLEDYGKNRFRDQICSSAVEDGDFARYEIDSLAGRFLLLSREEHGRSMREIYEEWHTKAIVPFPKRQAALDRVIEVAGRLNSMPTRFDLWTFSSGADGEFDARRALEDQRDAAIAKLEALLTKEELLEFEIRAAGFLRGRMWDEQAAAWHPTYAGMSARRWVAWRAHELGWNPERFSDFDRRVPSGGRMEHRIERIGKKYQWIALHELAGRLSDIALVAGSFRDEPVPYRGPWQISAREMDPTVLVTRTKESVSNRQSATWWSPHVSRWRDDPPEARIAWMEDETRDLPDPVSQIDVADAGGRRWLVLDTTVSRNQWCMVDGERVIHRMTWHKVKSMLVSRGDANRLEAWLARSDRDRREPTEVEIPSGGYLGEYPWHPAFANIDGLYHLGDGDTVPVEATVADWYIERSGHNYSIEESLNFTVPAPALIRGLGLQLVEGRSLAYSDAAGRIVFKDPSVDEPGFSAAVVDRDAMRAFLEAGTSEIVWTFTGEKSAHGGRPHGSGWGGELNYWGIYRFDGHSVRGALNFERRHASRGQLTEFLSNP